MASPAAVPAMNAADLTGRRLGRYEVLCMLASGGMATVYVARAQGVAGFERLVAVKVLHPHLAHDEDFISMFLDEARLAARIRHPNAVGTLDISDTQGDGYFLVMEYVEGDHFGALLRNAAKGGERLPVNVVARVVMDALAGLYAAHHLTDSTGQPLDLVHRDVSPHNVLIGGDGVARITDFGVAKAQVRLSSTRDGQFKGKLSYMAPEQAASGEADQRSDLFSMGIVLWEALTGRRLFRGENNADVLNKILNPMVPPPSTFDPSLEPFDAVTAKALAKEPDDRFQDAEDFLEAIEEAAAQIGGVATPRAVGKEVKRWLGDKIARERQQIRDAIDALGRSELTPGVLPRPMEGGSQPSQPGAASLVRPIGEGDDHTVGAKPSTLAGQPVEPSGGGRGVWMAVAGVLALCLVGGGAAAWVLLGDETAPAVQAPAPGTPTRPDPSTGAAAPAADPTEEAGEPAQAHAPTGSTEATAGSTDEATDGDPASEDGDATGDEGLDRAARLRARRRLEARRRARQEAQRGSGSEDDQGSTTSGSTTSGATQTGGGSPESAGQRGGSGSASGSDDDELILNPYRR
ncbi:MAG TPA: protein kinase [Sandaracinaceae bacterium LLY-WYZ-13_1]|nr:protein kinase [Sandaracinaceae bacterium LLY-WYZ-13_1]